MSFSTIVSTGTPQAYLGGTSSINGNLPASRVAGNGLIAVVAADTATSIPTPSGWTDAFTALAGNSRKVYGFKRIATADASDTLTIDRSSGATGFACIIRQVAKPSGAMILADIEATRNSTFGPADPPSITPSWGAGDTLAVIFGSQDSGGVTYPSGYTADQASTGDTGNSDELHTASKQFTGTSEDPPAFGNSRGFGFGVTFAIRGSAAAPTIGTQPTAQSVTAPAAATFTAAVSGSYTGLRWQRQAAGAGGWSDISGATSTSLTTGATSVTGGSWNNTDRVRLQVDWSGGTVTSTDVALTVVAGGTAPAFTVQPSNQSVTVGATATFTATATGSGSLSHQWQRQPAAGGGYSDISGATGASYTTPVTTISGGSANNGDTYRRVTTGDTSPPATSSAATLTVLQPVATTVSVTLTTDGSTPAASLTNLKWAFYDQATPNLFTAAPVAKGAVGTTNGSGVFSASISGTALRQGDIGYLIVTNSDGTVTQGAALKAFAAPVVVS